MKLLVKRCHTCKARGLGPGAVKLWPFEGRLYCAEDYKDTLTWHESRPNIVMALMFEIAKPNEVKIWDKPDWKQYIFECCQMAEWALGKDKRTFVHYFSRAMYAWTLKELA